MELKKKLAEKYGVGVGQVSVSSGAKPFLSFVFMSLLDEGDVVLMAGPFYPPFVQIVESCGGQVCLIDTKPTNFKLTLDLIEEAVKEENVDGRKIHLLLNSPNNPTGTTCDEGELKKIVRWCDEKDIVVVSDECYSNFSVNPDFTLRNFSENVIVINSFSKTYAMTGWRIGYVVCPEELNVVIGRFLDSYLGCPSSISDAAAIVAIETDPLPDFVEQRDMIHDWLEKHEVEYVKSTGGIFIFPDFSKFMRLKGITNSVDLATYFLENAEVATTPGISFGEKYDSHLRVSYCIEPEKLNIALQKLSEAMA
jgi:aspartate aminotransferase